MALRYTFVTRLASIYSKSKKKLIYATTQRAETVTTRDIAQHLASHNSVFSEGTIIGLLQDAQRCIMEQLKAGNRVDLDDLGAFYTTISSRGAKSAEDFDESYIKSINLRWKPSKRMTQAIKGVELIRVATRSEQRKAIKKMIVLTNEEVEKSKKKKNDTIATSTEQG